MPLFRHARIGLVGFVPIALLLVVALLVPQGASAKRGHHRSSDDGGTSDSESDDGGTADAGIAVDAGAPPVAAPSGSAPADVAAESRLTIDLDNQWGTDYHVVAAQILLDGKVLVTEKEGDADLQLTNWHIWSGLLPAGRSSVEVRLKYKMPNLPLASLNNDSFVVTETAKFSSLPGLTAVHAVAFVQGDWTTKIEKKAHLELHVAGPDTSCPL